MRSDNFVSAYNATSVNELVNKGKQLVVKDSALDNLVNHTEGFELSFKALDIDPNFTSALISLEKYKKFK
jgi:hypothetical protein